MAKKFHFQLESLLNLKVHKVKEIEEVIQKILYYKVQTQNEIAEQEEYLRTISNGSNGLHRIGDIQAQIHHKEFVANEITKLRQQLEKIIDIEKIYLERLQEAKKEEKILAKLKEKKFDNYNMEMKREETKFLDEISITKEIRKNIDNEQ